MHIYILEPLLNPAYASVHVHSHSFSALQVSDYLQFRVTLPSGHMFCYNIRGQRNTVYNLICSKHFEINAGFSANPLNSSISWMDSIGVTIFHQRKETTLIMFSASDWEVSIGESVSLEADKVEKIMVSQGKLMILPMYPTELTFSPNIMVHFEELGLDFSVQYTEVFHQGHKSFRLSLFWQSVGAIQIESLGIVGGTRTLVYNLCTLLIFIAGQLLQDGVSIDEAREELIIPDHAPISVTEIPVLKLHTAAVSKLADRRCWSTTSMMILSEGVVKGTDVDYQVDSLLLTGFKFGRM